MIEDCLLKGGDEKLSDFLLFVGEERCVFGPVFGSGCLHDEHSALVDPWPDQSGFSDNGAISAREETGFGGVHGEHSAGRIPVKSAFWWARCEAEQQEDREQVFGEGETHDRGGGFLLSWRQGVAAG